MITQYPHTIKFTTNDATTRDGNGDWVPGSSSVSVEIACRFEANQKSAMIADSSGTQIIYSGTVYLPLPVDTIAPGTIAEVLNGAEVLSKGSIIRFSKGQLNARLWL